MSDALSEGSSREAWKRLRCQEKYVLASNVLLNYLTLSNSCASPIIVHFLSVL